MLRLLLLNFVFNTHFKAEFSSACRHLFGICTVADVIDDPHHLLGQRAASLSKEAAG